MGETPPPQKCFEAFRSAMNRPEYDNEEDKAETYLRFDLPFLSDNVVGETLEISHARDVEISLL